MMSGNYATPPRFSTHLRCFGWIIRLGQKRHFIEMAFGLDEFLLCGSYDFQNCFSFFNRSSFRSTSRKWQKRLLKMAKKDKWAIALSDDLSFWKLEKIKWCYFFILRPFEKIMGDFVILAVFGCFILNSWCI